ncbi:hypothetical protein GCM10012289_27100 [Nonomuraea cavernae]|uniref:Uncharacterized protein n=1 Tax=Nonomuraea cavernae TaxID=2045107 RepID=A0A917YW75_9ACTN|nr:hypothetical protein GCM10012289_27100 [Nonomuraea cavernae]
MIRASGWGATWAQVSDRDGLGGDKEETDGDKSITDGTRARSRRDRSSGNPRHMTARCDSCSGRGWKYISLRRGVVAAENPDDAASGDGCRGDCWRCNGTGEAGALS